MKNLLGQRIKQLRNDQKMSLATLSERCGLSIGYLSKIEKGLSSVTADKLTIIAKCLNANVSYFFDETVSVQKGRVAVRSYERRLQPYDQLKRYNFNLANNLDDKEFLPQYVELLPGYNEHMESFNHDGQEFIYVLEGVLTLCVSSERLELYPGDSAFFRADQDHVWANATAQTVKLVVVRTPNVYMAE